MIITVGTDVVKNKQQQSSSILNAYIYIFEDLKSIIRSVSKTFSIDTSNIPNTPTVSVPFYPRAEILKNLFNILTFNVQIQTRFNFKTKRKQCSKSECV